MKNDFSDEARFRQAVKDILVKLLDQVDEIDSDDHDPSMSDGNLKVVFEDGATFILSQQPPTRLHIARLVKRTPGQLHSMALYSF